MKREKLIVFGGSGFIGQEICRLGRALGHEIVSISRSGRPALDEPWVQGIEWVEGNVCDVPSWQGMLEGAYGIVLSLGPEMHPEVAEIIAKKALEAQVHKLVFIAHDSGASELEAELHRQIASIEISTAVLRVPEVSAQEESPLEHLIRGPSSSNLPGPQVLRVERVAMGALRAVLEEDIEGIIDASTLAYLGDAVMIQ